MMEIESFILDWVKEKTGFTLASNQNFFEAPAFDSLSFAQLVSTIEDEFDIEVNFVEVEDWSSLLNPTGLAAHIGKS
jgi:acyl carrier protein